MSQLASQHKPYFVSWSGGKDSTLALYRAKKLYGPPNFLYTTMNPEGTRSAGHGVHRDVMVEQAKCLGIPIVFSNACWDSHEAVFRGFLTDVAQQGIKMAVFGDIHLDRSWVDCRCAEAGIESVEPLWLESPENLISDWFSNKFTTQIIAIKHKKVMSDVLGQVYSRKLIHSLKTQSIDPHGENGEFHTIVTNGPLFKRPLKLKQGRTVTLGGYQFLDLGLQSQVL